MNRPNAKKPIMPYTLAVVSLLLARSLGPYLNKTQGIGISATEMKAKTLVAQPTPRLLYTKIIDISNLVLEWGLSPTLIDE